MKSFRNLIIWQKSMKLVEDCYTLTTHFPAHEQFGLTSQIRRSAISIPSNIAEGYGRISNKEYYRFLKYCNGIIIRISNTT